MTNAEVARLLGTIAGILDLQGENPFKVRAYLNAARTIESLEVTVHSLLEQGTLGELRGIGPALEEKLTELCRTGKMKYYEELCASVPPVALEMMRIPFLGARKTKVLCSELKIGSLAELEKACREGRVAGLKGFGAKTEKKILEGIERLAKYSGQHLLAELRPVARQMAEFLRKLPAVRKVESCGSLRRGKSVLGDIDLLASSDAPREVIDALAGAAMVESVLGRGDTKGSVRLNNGMQLDLRVVSDAEFPSALQYFTGSKEHNIQLRARAGKMGLLLNEYGLFKGKRRLDVDSEEALYRHLKLAYIPPELREGRGEIELAEEGKVPKLLEQKDLRGLLHVHSLWSDGTATVEAMAIKAREMGLEWMGISDHSQAASYANGMTETRLRQQMKEVAALNGKWKGFRILQGLECDILPDGSLDLSDELLGRLDFVIGSIHSQFGMPGPEMTARVCKAIANPHLDCFGHPTGRLLLRREGYAIDLEKVIDAARDAGKMIEINADPHRLDLDDHFARLARSRGVLLSINPDAHSIGGLENVEFGVTTARRAGLGPADVFNSLPVRKAMDRLGRN